MVWDGQMGVLASNLNPLISKPQFRCGRWPTVGGPGLRDKRLADVKLTVGEKREGGPHGLNSFGTRSRR